MALTDRGTREGEVVAHLVHVAALAAEVDLHVDHEEHLTHAPVFESPQLRARLRERAAEQTKSRAH